MTTSAHPASGPPPTQGLGVEWGGHAGSRVVPGSSGAAGPKGQTAVGEGLEAQLEWWFPDAAGRPGPRAVWGVVSLGIISRLRGRKRLRCAGKDEEDSAEEGRGVLEARPERIQGSR